MIKTGVVWEAQHGTWTKFGAITAAKKAIMQTIALSFLKTSFDLGNLCIGDWD